MTRSRHSAHGPDGANGSHERRRLRLNRRMDSPDHRDEWYGEQCLHCRVYVPLDGQLGEDYGACTNALSPFDGRVMFEHDGCEAFEEADHGAAGACADDRKADRQRGTKPKPDKNPKD